MIQTDTQSGLQEEVETSSAELDQDKIQADTQAMLEATPLDESEGVEVAGLSTGIIKSVAKNLRKGVKTSDAEAEYLEGLLNKYDIKKPDHIKKQEIKHEEKLKELEEKVKTDQAEISKPATVDTNPYTKNFNVTDATTDAQSVLKGSELDPTNTWEMNYKTISETNDIKSVISQQANKFKTEIDEARRNVVPDDELIELSRLIGSNPDEIKKIMERQTGDVLSPEYVLASKQLVVDSAKRLYELAQKVKGGTSADQLAFAKHQFFHKQLYKQFMGLRAEYGRGLRAFQIKGGSSEFESMQIAEAIFDAKHGMNPERMAEAVLNTNGDVMDIANLTKGNMFETFMNKGLDALHAYRVGSVLSGLKTQIVNAVAIPSQLGLHALDTANASMFGFLNTSKLLHDNIKLRDVKSQLAGEFYSWWDSAKMALKTIKSGEEYGMGSKLEMPTFDDPLKAENLFGSKVEGTRFQSVWNTTADGLQFVSKNIMGGVDTFGKFMTERGEMYKIAFKRVEEVAEREKLSQTEATKLLQYMMENPSEDMLRESAEVAKRVVFQEGNPDVDKALQSLGNRFFRNIFMFRRTPTNILKQAFIDRTPLAPLAKKNRDAWNAGGASRQQLMGRITTGTELFGIAYMLTQNDMITGATPKDRTERERWRQAGIKPYSIKLGDTYVSYEKLEPISNIMGALSTVSSMLDKANMYVLGEDEEDKMSRIIGATITAIGTQTLDKSFMVGLKSVFDAFEHESSAERFLQNFAGSMVPFSGVQRDIKYLMENDVRVGDDTWEYIKSWTPFDFDKLEKLHDFYGKPVKLEQRANPIKVFEAKKEDVILKEARIISEATGGKNFMKMPNEIQGYVKLKPQEYNTFVKFARSDVEIEVGGDFVDFKGMLKKVITDEDLKKASPETRLEKINQAISKWDRASYLYFIRDKEKHQKKYILMKSKDYFYESAFNTGRKLEDIMQDELEEVYQNNKDDYENSTILEYGNTWRIKPNQKKGK